MEGAEGPQLHVDLRNSSRGDAKQASPSPSLAAVKMLAPILVILLSKIISNYF